MQLVKNGATIIAISQPFIAIATIPTATLSLNYIGNFAVNAGLLTDWLGCAHPICEKII